MEKTTGLFNGIAVAVAVAGLARTSVDRADRRDTRPWTEPLALAFVLIGIPYLNSRKNVAQWVATRSIPAEMAGISSARWFDLGYLALTLTFLSLWFRHRRRPLPVLAASWLGKGQLLYLGMLWTAVIFNFERALVAFQTQRLVTEGVLYLVALACTLVLLLTAGRGDEPADEPPRASVANWRTGLGMTVALGMLAAALSIVADWGTVRAIYGDRFAGHAALHIRFGPRATINKPENR